MSKRTIITDELKSTNSGDPIINSSVLRYSEEFEFENDLDIPHIARVNELIAEATGSLGDFMPRAAGEEFPFTGNVYMDGHYILDVPVVGNTDGSNASSVQLIPGVQTSLYAISSTGSSSVLNVYADGHFTIDVVDETEASGSLEFGPVTGLRIRTGNANAANILGTNVVNDYDAYLPDKTGTQVFAMLSDIYGSGSWIVQGGYDASSNAYPTTSDVTKPEPGAAIAAGFQWIITTGGTLGGVDVASGDVLVALNDSPASSSDWFVLEKNIAYTPLDIAGSNAMNADLDLGGFDLINAFAVYTGGDEVFSFDGRYGVDVNGNIAFDFYDLTDGFYMYNEDGFGGIHDVTALTDHRRFPWQDKDYTAVADTADIAAAIEDVLPSLPSPDGFEWRLRVIDEVLSWVKEPDAYGTSIAVRDKLQADEAADWDADGIYVGATSGAIVIGTDCQPGEEFPGESFGTNCVFKCFPDGWRRMEVII